MMPPLPKSILLIILAVTLMAVKSTALAQPESTEDAAADPAAKAKAAITSAYNLSQAAKTLDEYSEVIKACDDALTFEISEKQKKYVTSLKSWALNRRGQEYSRQAGEKSSTEERSALEAKAMADFQAAVELDPDRWRAVHNRAVNYALLGQFDKALADLNRTIELNPAYPSAWFNRAEIRFQQGKLDEAISDYTRAIRLKPDDAAFYAARGHAYYRQEKYDDAVADFTSAIRQKPSSAGYYVDRGNAYLDQSNWSQAAQDFRTAISLDDQLGRAYQSAAWLMAVCPDGRYRDADRAVAAAQRAIQLNGDDFRYLDTLAAAQASAGDFDAAVSTMDKAIKDAPEAAHKGLKARKALYEMKRAYRAR